MYQTFRFRSCLGFFVSIIAGSGFIRWRRLVFWCLFVKMAQACIWLVVYRKEQACILRCRFLRRLFRGIKFSLAWVRNISIITIITVNCISHSLNSAITKENVVFFSGRASISGLRIAKILKKIFSNGSGQEGREYNEYLKIEIGSINFHASFEMFWDHYLRPLIQ